MQPVADVGLRSDLRAERTRLIEAGDDHFYGAWKGGRKAEGGHSDAGGVATAPAKDEAVDAAAKMAAKYPGTQWGDLAKLEPSLVGPVTEEVDGLIGRYGPPPNFRGVRVGHGPSGVIAEVKHVPEGNGSALYLYGHRWTSPGAMQAEAVSMTASHPKWSTSEFAVKAAPKGQEAAAYSRAIIAHEMGHEYLGLNLHSRLGADRNAAVRKELEPMLHNDFFPNLGKAHVSQYARKNPHEAWAELWTAANGHGASSSHYTGMLKNILDKHYPPKAGLKEAASDAPAMVTIDGVGKGPSCGWALAHPEASSIVSPIAEASDDHFHGAWRGGSKAEGGGPAIRSNPSGNGTLMHDVTPANPTKGPPAAWSSIPNSNLLKGGAHVGIVKAAAINRGYVERFDGDNLILRGEDGAYRLIRPDVVRRVNDVPQSSVVRERDVPLVERKADEHFYGPWLGGSKIEGGHPPVHGKRAGQVAGEAIPKSQRGRDLFKSDKAIAKAAKEAKRAASARIEAERRLAQDWMARQGLTAQQYARYLGADIMGHANPLATARA